MKMSAYKRKIEVLKNDPVNESEIKSILGISHYKELKIMAEKENRTVNQYIKLKIALNMKQPKTKISTKDVTFGNSKPVPFQRWYPYIEGYSPSFVLSLIDSYCPDAHIIYEPFAGTGTTIFASDMRGKNTLYSEINPVLRFLIKTKIEILTLPMDERKALAASIRDLSESLFDKMKDFKPSQDLSKNYDLSFGKSVYFPSDQLDHILKIRSYIDKLYDKKKNILADVLSVATIAILIPVSYLKKQGDVRFKTTKELETQMQYIKDVLPQKLIDISEDIENADFSLSCQHDMVKENAKEIGDVETPMIDAVITSPPYLNGTNYFRNTKLELWFLRYLHSDADLRMFRDEALTSGINDVKSEYRSKELLFTSKLFDETEKVLIAKAYDKRIPLMARCYFNEMYELFSGLTKHLNQDAKILIDLGDSIFSNVHIKTDYILVEILNDLGYALTNREILRQRRSRNGELLSQVLLSFTYNKV